MGSTKTIKCTKCHIVKPLSEFRFRKDKGYYRKQCKQCEWVAEKKRRLKNPNPVKGKALLQYYRIKARQNYYENKERCKENSRLWHERNPEYSANYSKEYSKNNKSKNREYAREYYKTIRKNDFNWIFAVRIRDRIRRALKVQRTYKNNTTCELIGCSWIELREYLESLFTEGMTWSNHSLKGWHIDHIKPCVSFDLRDLVQQKQCFHYTNLQPLWAIDNQRKGAKVG